MKKTYPYIFLALMGFTLSGCDFIRSLRGGGEEASPSDAQEVFSEEQSLQLEALQLPCSKEQISSAWQLIGETDKSVDKTLDYRHSYPTFFLSVDLDGDGQAEVLTHGEDACAAVFSLENDSVVPVSYVVHPCQGLGVAHGGYVVRTGNTDAKTTVMDFVRLENSKVIFVGKRTEKFALQDNKFVSTGSQYLVQRDSAMVEVKKDEFTQVAPGNDVTYFDAVEGWEDFRKP